jgi:putative pantetheine hydrolase
VPQDDATGNPFGALTDVPGVLVGHAHRADGGWLSGCTVVVPPEGAVGGADVRGGGPATAETDALGPGTVSGRVDAVLLTGGSAFGLPAAAGVQRWCEEQPRGFQVGPEPYHVVPIVPALALFDLGRGGDLAARPDAAMAYAAAAAARTGRVGTGAVGAGTGALVAGRSLKGGTGTASVRLAGGVVVGALAAVNAAGSPVDPATGGLLAVSALEDASRRPGVPADGERAALVAAAEAAAGPPPRNTTLVVVATNALLSPAQAQRLAVAGQAGVARSLHPAHTLADGDAVVALATGELDASSAAPGEPPWPGARGLAGEVAVQAAASTAVALAVLDAVLAASRTRTPAIDVPGYLDLCPSVARRVR